MARLVLMALALASCADVPLDDVRWACAADRDCGEGARCEDGLCVPLGAPRGDGGLVCEIVAQGAASAASARFAIDDVDGQRRMTFTVGATSASFDVPDEVADLADGPLEACCEAACCAAITR